MSCIEVASDLDAKCIAKMPCFVMIAGVMFMYKYLFFHHVVGSCVQVISDFDEMKKLISRLHLSLEGEDQDNEDFMKR